MQKINRRKKRLGSLKKRVPELALPIRYQYPHRLLFAA